jgi:hypothetical protein
VIPARYLQIDVESITNMMREMVNTFSTSVPPRVVRSRRELYRVKYEVKLTKKRLMRNFRQMTGYSLLNAKRKHPPQRLHHAHA